MASCYALAVDGMSPADLHQAVAAAVGGDSTDTKGWQPLPGGLWQVDAFDPADADAFAFEPTAEVHFCANASEIELADASIGKVVLAILQAHDINAWLGFEGTETLRRTHGQTTKASRSMWGDLADTLNQGLSAA